MSPASPLMKTAKHALSKAFNPWANKATSTKDSLGSISKRKSLLLGSMALEIDFRVK